MVAFSLRVIDPFQMDRERERRVSDGERDHSARCHQQSICGSFRAEEWLPQGDEEGKVVSGEEGGFGEEAVMEVMKGLEAEITGSGSSSSSCDAYTSGNHETFCPSFSDSKTTVMASIDMAGVVFKMPSSSETEDSGSQIPAATEPSCSSIEDAEDSSWWLGMKRVGNFSLMTLFASKELRNFFSVSLFLFLFLLSPLSFHYLHLFFTLSVGDGFVQFHSISFAKVSLSKAANGFFPSKSSNCVSSL